MKIAVVLFAVLFSFACSDPPPPPKVDTPKPAATPTPTPTPAATPTPTPAAATPPPAAMDPTAEAEQIFTTRCSVCHGMSGKGDGPGAVALNPKPRNYTDATWQASVDDAHIAKTIVEGGAAVGKSPLMAPNADLKDKPDVVKALVAKVRSFKGK